MPTKADSKSKPTPRKTRSDKNQEQAHPLTKSFLKPRLSKLFDLVNDESVAQEIRLEIMTYIDEVIDNSPSYDWRSNKARFKAYFIEGVEEGGISHGLREIIIRMDKGESPERIIKDIERRSAEAAREYELAKDLKPEPEDKNSDAYRHWKLRQMSKTLRGAWGTKAQRKAWREFNDYMRRAVRAARKDPGLALELLPYFIMACQKEKGGLER